MSALGPIGGGGKIPHDPTYYEKIQKGKTDNDNEKDLENINGGASTDQPRSSSVRIDVNANDSVKMTIEIGNKKTNVISEVINNISNFGKWLFGFGG